MAELKIYLSDSLSEKFRQVAMSVYGYGRGSLSKAAEEALAKWCSEHEPSRVPEQKAGKEASAQGNAAEGAESHVNPDERENPNQGRDRLGGDPPRIQLRQAPNGKVTSMSWNRSQKLASLFTGS